jgi:hypothetical protein
LLLHISAALFAIPFAGQRFLGPLFLAWFQVKGVAFNLFDYVFLLHFAFEPPQGAFKSLAVLDIDFSQKLLTSLTYQLVFL